MPKTDHRVTLTDNKVKGIKLAKLGRRFQVMDSVVPGFGVRVSDKSKTYILRTRFPGLGSATRREIGKAGDISLADARDVARRWRELARKGIDPADQDRKEREAAAVKLRTTFAAVVHDFERDKLATERKGEDAMREFRRDLLPIWGEMPITEITDLHIAALIKERGRKRNVPKFKGSGGKIAARNLLSLIKRFFRWAAAQPEYGLSRSPCLYLRASDLLGDMPRPRARVLTDDELFALWRAASRMAYPHGPAYQLLCLTALRLNEAMDAAWDEFKFREGVWEIPALRMKGKESKAQPHAVPLTKDILAVLESLPRFKGGKFLFSTTAGRTAAWIGSNVKARLDRRMLRTLKALAKMRGDDPALVTLPAFVNHDVRRTVRSRLSRLKIADEAREAVLAHARPGIKGVYDLHDYLDEKREALELWAARLREIVTPKPDNVIKLHAMA
jgi:integrase